MNDITKEILNSKFPIMVKASAGTGKCVTGDTLIFTNNGIMKIEDIYNNKTEAMVFSHEEKNNYPCSSMPSHVYKLYHNNNVIRIKTSFGYEICGTPEHRIYTYNSTNIEPEYKKLADITKDDIILLSQNIQYRNNELSIFSDKDIDNAIKNSIISDKILSLRSDIMKDFLIKLLEKIGYQNKNLALLYVKSKIMAQQIQLMWLRCKVVAKIGIHNAEQYYVAIDKSQTHWEYRYNALKLKRLPSDIDFGQKNYGIIPPPLLSKNDFIDTDEDDYWKKTINYIVKHKLYLRYDDLNGTRRFIKDKVMAEKMLSMVRNFFFDRVAEITEEFAEYVYDYTVPVYHNFVANGFINHNTYCLIEKIKHTVLVDKVEPNNILTLTFTQDAAQELKNRLPIECDGVTAGTIHSIMWNVVKQHLGVSVYVADDTVRQSIAFDILKNNASLKNDFDKIPKFLSSVAFMKSTRLDYFDLINNHQEDEFESSKMFLFASEYEKSCTKRHKVDFESMILLAHKIFTEKPNVLEFYQNKYKYIFLDESQDSSPVQVSVILLLAQKYMNFFAVGDQKQAIFSFQTG